MVDFVSPEKRSKIMRGVKGKNTRPEVVVRKRLHALGLRFRLHRAGLPGRPDIILPRHNLVIMVHGCFWHQHVGCKECRIPTSNSDFWTSKLSRNKERDAVTARSLRRLGWRVKTIWECQTKQPAQLEKALKRVLHDLTIL
jgi:DNA mismatch endonuclease (patch repair protein)